MELSDFWGLAGAPLVIALIEGVKRSVPEIPDRLLPALALLFGVAINLYLATLLDQEFAVAAFVGLVTGLSAMGLFSGVKKTAGH